LPLGWSFEIYTCFEIGLDLIVPAYLWKSHLLVESVIVKIKAYHFC
jgi:hypothetical protein